MRSWGGEEDSNWEGSCPAGGMERIKAPLDQNGQKRGRESEEEEGEEDRRKRAGPGENKREEEATWFSWRWCMCLGGRLSCTHRGVRTVDDGGMDCRDCGRWVCRDCTTEPMGARRQVCCNCAWRQRFLEMLDDVVGEEEDEDSDTMYWPSALERGACSDEPEEDEAESEEEDEDSDTMYWPSALERGACSDEPEEDEEDVEEGEEESQMEELEDEEIENQEGADNVEREEAAVDGVTQMSGTAEDDLVLNGSDADVGNPRGECQYRETGT